MFKLLTLNVDKRGVASIELNRPEIHNAFNDELIDEVIRALDFCQNEKGVRLVVLSGNGKSFCAGADLNWMASMVNYSKHENYEDSLKLAKMFKMAYNFSKPLIGKVGGHALGGGVGLVAVCDYVLAKKGSLFGFTEVRLGLIPAVISPFCIKKIGASNARAWFMSGERFGTFQAFHMGLINEECDDEAELESRTSEVVEGFLKAAPEAAILAKSLINEVVHRSDDGDIEEYVCHAISDRRVSAEGQEGMKALLNKNKPSWMS